QITGMNPMEEHDPNDQYVYPNRPAWQRFLTILAGPLMNYVAAVVIVFTVFVAWGIPQPSKTQQISDVMPNTPAAAIGLLPGDVLVSIDGQPVNFDHQASEVLD